MSRHRVSNGHGRAGHGVQVGRGLAEVVAMARIMSRRAGMLAAVYAVGWTVGAVLVAYGDNVRLSAFGLGLMAPGGGLAYYGHWPELLVLEVVLAWLARKREWALIGYAWFAVGAVMLTHAPHPDMFWPAAVWVVPAATVVPALVCVALLIRRLAAGSVDQSVGQRSPK